MKTTYKKLILAIAVVGIGLTSAPSLSFAKIYCDTQLNKKGKKIKVCKPVCTKKGQKGCWVA